MNIFGLIQLSSKFGKGLHVDNLRLHRAMVFQKMAQQCIPQNEVQCETPRKAHIQIEHVPLDLVNSVRDHHHHHLHGHSLLQRCAGHSGGYRFLAFDSLLPYRDVHASSQCEEMEPEVYPPPVAQFYHASGVHCWLDWRCGGDHRSAPGRHPFQGYSLKPILSLV